MRIKYVLPVIALAAGTAFTTATPASADTNCSIGNFCLFYNSGMAGTHLHFNNSVADLAGYTFDCCGAGAGQSVKNNAASARNDFTNYNVRVYYNSNYSGPSDLFAPGTAKNLVNTYNEDASLRTFS
ncbi:peptidase inhibitor family I36 protein [Streptomyces sp. NBC_00989]|uniref:peptidase inhibitor family I36 protein n=1 Tax=Streptomyces sp. NBC_00989 TaxID=2903705 RepID=UPI003866DBE9|nr:peptidase inhibitor family I36 protein [Streptomyces sp. NBC_00989]